MTSEESNGAAFLKLIRFAEHKTDSDDVYFLLYGGRERFTDVSKHPNKLIKAWGHQSTAAGEGLQLFDGHVAELSKQ